MDKKQEAYNSLKQELNELKENGKLPKLDYIPIKPTLIVTNIPTEAWHTLYISINDKGGREFYSGTPQRGKTLKDKTLQAIVDRLKKGNIENIENMMPLIHGTNIKKNPPAGGHNI